uniref:Putative secreted protein n=1 Tax=Anopheles darlingi TaxID=43151 RepID=A0A2M4DHB2_ANODA
MLEPVLVAVAATMATGANNTLPIWHSNSNSRYNMRVPVVAEEQDRKDPLLRRYLATRQHQVALNSSDIKAAQHRQS